LFLSKKQTVAKINRIKKFYNKVFVKQLLSPKKSVLQLLEPTNDAQAGERHRKQSTNSRHFGFSRNSFINRRISTRKIEDLHPDTIETAKIYRRTLNETPQRQLFSSTALKMALKFSWRLFVIIAINLIGNFFLFDKIRSIAKLVDFHQNFVEMAAASVNMNSMASHNFAQYSNITFVNEQYVKSRGIAAKNFYNFLGSLEDSTIINFFYRTNGIDKIQNDADILKLKNFNSVFESNKPSLFYMNDRNSNGRLIRGSLNEESIARIQGDVNHIVDLGFKTVFLSHLNFNDYLLIYHGKLPQSEDSFLQIESNLHQLLLANSNMFDYIMNIFDEALSDFRRIFYRDGILFSVLFIVVFVWLMRDQLWLYSKAMPKDFFYCRNIVNLFHVTEFWENKILEKFFIEEIMPSLNH
jgi:hypothetical protein